MKRILLLADGNSSHTQKWALGLAGKDFEIGIFSLGNTDVSWCSGQKNISILNKSEIAKNIFRSAVFKKVSYLKVLPQLKKAITYFKPDIVHAHYATSYGLLGRLSGFHPFIISCWGSDVMDFPQKGFLQKKILQSNLKAADLVLATSKTIDNYIQKVIPLPVVVLPFGIDTEVFHSKKVDSIFLPDDIVIGTIKSLEKIYRIDLLLEGFAKLRKTRNNCKLLIVGEGTQKDNLVSLAKKLEITHDVYFAGKINHADVVDYHNMIDVFINISDNESFGVSVLESMACGKPVIVTNTGGLTEIVESDKVGLKIPVGDLFALISAMTLLVDNKQMRLEMGYQAQQMVSKKFSWNNNLQSMISYYNNIVAR